MNIKLDYYFRYNIIKFNLELSANLEKSIDS